MGRKSSLKFEKGELYEIIFKDHSTGPKGVAIFRVSGYCYMDFPDHVRLTHWYLCTDDIEFFESNLELSSILKSTIIEVKKLCKMKKKLPLK